MTLPVVEREPGILQLEVTSRCNLDCKICPHAGLDEMQDMDYGLFCRIIDQFTTTPHTVYLCGLGEPLMHPRLDDMIRHCAARGMSGTVIHTNGTMLTAERANRLADAGLSEIRLSIDGGDAQTLAAVRPGVRLSLLTMRMRHVTRNTRMKASLYFTANKENLASLPGLVDVAVEMGVTQIYVVDTVPFAGQGKPVALWATRTRKLTSLEDSGKFAVMRRFRARAAEHGIAVSESLDSFRESCRDPFGKMYVTWKGELTPCCRIHTTPTVGDLRAETLQDAWHGEALAAWRAQLYSASPHPACRHLCNLPPQSQTAAA